MELRWSHGADPDFCILTQALDAYFRTVLGDRQAKFDPYNHADALTDVALLYDEGRAIACAALKRLSDGSAEIKRVYVSPEYRGAGCATQLLTALEKRAHLSGCARLLIETNPLFLDAVQLYRRYGFTPIEPYGLYQVMDTLCMQKTVAGSGVPDGFAPEDKPAV